MRLKPLAQSALMGGGVMSINLAAEPERASAQNKVGAMVQDHSLFTDLTKEKGHGTWLHTIWTPSTHVGQLK